MSKLSAQVPQGKCITQNAISKSALSSSKWLSHKLRQKMHRNKNKNHSSYNLQMCQKP